MRRSFIKIRLGKRLILLLLLAIFSVAALSCMPSYGGGCAGPGSQGWSGFVEHNGILYFGSMDGKVLAVNPSARAKGLTFPGDGEWSYVIKSAPSSGAMCGFGCVPASQTVSIYSTPAVAGDLVYVGAYNGKVYALNAATGALRWVYPREGYETTGAIVGNLSIADDAIYIGSSDGKVYALDAATGDRRWDFETSGKIWTSPAIGDRTVYVGNHDGNFYALASQDGSLLWEVKLPAAIASSPVISGDDILFGTFDRYLHSIRIADGKEKWQFEGENWFWASPLVKDNIVYAGCLDHRIYALDASKGHELWQFVADEPIVSSPVIMSDLLVAVSESGEMYIINADTGVLERTVSIGHSVMAPLYTDGDIVYVHARDRYIYAIDVQAGKMVWKFSLIVE